MNFYIFLHLIISLIHSSFIWSSISLKGRITPHLNLHGTTLKKQLSDLWNSRSLLSINPQVELLGQSTFWYSQTSKCFIRFPFLITFCHFSFIHLMLNSLTSLLIGIFGIKSLLRNSFQTGHSDLFRSSLTITICKIHFSQKRL